MRSRTYTDIGSFEGWYARAYQPSLRALLFICSGDVQRAEDVVCEAFARALEQWDSVSKMESPEGWLVRVAINLEKRRLRRRSRECELATFLHTPQPEQTQVPSHDIWELVRSLPARQRHAMARRYIDDWSQAQIAEEMGISGGTAAATLNQARRRIRNEIVGGQE